MKQKLQCAYEH